MGSNLVADCHGDSRRDVYSLVFENSCRMYRGCLTNGLRTYRGCLTNGCRTNGVRWMNGCRTNGWCLTIGCVMIGLVIEEYQLGNNSMREESVVTFTTHGLTSYTCLSLTCLVFPQLMGNKTRGCYWKTWTIRLQTWVTSTAQKTRSNNRLLL